jgi:hypothetical protein
VVSSQLVNLRRSFTSYLQSLASTRLSLPSALSLQQILFVALLVNFLIFSPHLSLPRGKSFIPMFSRGTFPAFILSSALVAFAADIIPTVPDPGHIYNEGSTCQVGWTPDSTGQWKSMNIQLMTGSNFQMVPLTSSSSCIFLVQVMIDPCPSYPPAVATVDGTTSPGTFSYPCPAVRVAVYWPRSHFDLFKSMSFFQVTPHASIYFYQFSHAANASDLLWTGRFAIADASGATVPAPNPTQPDGEAIPWGNGALADPSKAVPPPSYLPGGTGSNGTSAAPASGSASPSLAVPSSSKSPVAAVPSDATTASSSGSPSAANSAGNAIASNGSSNGALMLGAVSARAAQAGVALAVIAGAFTLMV